MSSLLVKNATSGLEHMERAAFFVAFRHLNSYLAKVSEAWAEADQEFAVATGRPAVVVNLDPIENINFHQGHRPSLITAPMESYPNFAVMIPRSTKGPGSDASDHGSVTSVTMIVEMMAYTDVVDGISALNSKAHRMAEACEAMFAEHQTLSGTISGIDGPPTITVGGVFPRREKEGRGKEWHWQGARLEFPIRKDSVRMSSGSDAFFNPSGSTAVTAAQYEIDQR